MPYLYAIRTRNSQPKLRDEDTESASAQVWYKRAPSNTAAVYTRRQQEGGLYDRSKYQSSYSHHFRRNRYFSTSGH